MRVVHAEFVRLDELPVSALIGALGVYVIWDGKARKRPTYIGEGSILDRLGQHAGRFAWPFDGYLALLGDWSAARSKRDAEILESVLLAVAEDTDRWPTQNKALGKMRAVHRVFRSHGTLRISLTGWDPLLVPRQSRPLARAKVATVRHLSALPRLLARAEKTSKPHFLSGEVPYLLEHDWRLRRLQS